jgi:hypothetical protein
MLQGIGPQPNAMYHRSVRGECPGASQRAGVDGHPQKFFAGQGEIFSRGLWSTLRRLDCRVALLAL